MPVPTSIDDLSINAIENSPQGTEPAKGTIDDYFRQHASFIAGLRDRAQGDTVSVKGRQFDAKGDGLADDTSAMQAALDYAAANGLGVYVPSGTYRISKLRINAGCTAFWTDSAKLLGITQVHEGLIELGGTFFGSAPVGSCKIHGFTLDGGGVARRGIFAATASGCFIFNNVITNLSPTIPEGGIALHFNSAQNRVYSNRIIMPDGPDCVGIFCISQTVDQYSGWMNGGIVDPTGVASHNAIFGNHIDGGSHGISMFGARFNNVYGNICRGQRDRSIILSPASSYNLIANNECLDFGSTGIHLAYGSVQNVISGNQLIAFGSTGEAGMQAYIACSSNKFHGNSIVCGSRYGIYLAIDAVANEVTGNRISGPIKLAGIAIESDWSGSLPLGALYSRPNYGPPAAPRVNWPNGVTANNVVSGNTMADLPSGIAALSIAQIGSFAANQGNVINGNTVTGAAPAHYLHLFEQSSGLSSGHTIDNQRFSLYDPARIALTRGRAHMASCQGNSILNDPASFYTHPKVAILDVAKADSISTAAFDSATTVTGFANGMGGQRLVVRMSVYTTIQASASVKLKGGVNASGADSNDYMIFQSMNGTWVELSRTF